MSYYGVLDSMAIFLSWMRSGYFEQGLSCIALGTEISIVRLNCLPIYISKGFLLALLLLAKCFHTRSLVRQVCSLELYNSPSFREKSLWSKHVFLVGHRSQVDNQPQWPLYACFWLCFSVIGRNSQCHGGLLVYLPSMLSCNPQPASDLYNLQRSLWISYPHLALVCVLSHWNPWSSSSWLLNLYAWYTWLLRSINCLRTF